ncbi:hypothetical protein K438DRAFT_1982277 [Mycena galopus ATCC 62051]|nr:hypothetical protein K438DRAFT_1982277 [Mycena galopus ATCC 62051]
MLSANSALPPELERKIFEMRSESMVVLLMVAKRVDRWIEPMLYRVLSIPAATPTQPHLQRPNLHCPITSVRQVLGVKGTAFFGAHVRHLAFFEQNGALESIPLLSHKDIELNRGAEIGACEGDNKWRQGGSACAAASRRGDYR